MLIITWVYPIAFYVILYFILEKSEGVVKYFADKSMKKVWIITYAIVAIVAFSSTFFQNEIKEVLRSTARNVFFGFILLYLYVDDYRKKYK